MKREIKSLLVHHIHSLLTLILVIIPFLIYSGNPCFSQPHKNTLISISNNGRYFIDQKGHPLFWQGDTEWELLHLFTVNDAKEFLLERKRQGFNVIQVMVTGVFPEWGKMQGMKPWKGMQAWKNNNPLTPDEYYFERADSIISFARDLGIILILGVYHARDEDAKRITLKNARP